MRKPSLPILLLLAVVALLGGVGALVWSGKHAPPKAVPTPVREPAETARELSAQMQDALTSGGDLTLILPDARKLADANPRCFEAQLLLGQLYMAQKRYDLAYAPTHNALALRPLGKELTKLLGTLAANTDRPAEAEALYRRALDGAPRSRERGMVRAMLGGLLRTQGKLDEADAQYALAVGDDAFLIPAHVARADLALSRNRIADALARIEEGSIWADSDPNLDTTPLTLMKARILLAQDQPDGAYRLLMAGLPVEKRLTPAAAAVLAQIWDRQGKPAKAAAQYESVIFALEAPPAPDAKPSSDEDPAAKQAQLKDAKAQAAKWWRKAGNEEAAKKWD